MFPGGLIGISLALGVRVSMVTTISAIGGLIGLVVTLCLLAWQSRATAEQAKIGNTMAGVSVVFAAFSALREVLKVFIDHPELYGYFYSGKSCPPSGRRRTRILVIADSLADVLESGLVATRLVPASESVEDWTDYCRQMLAHGPALSQIVNERRAWWPNLYRLAMRENRPNSTDSGSA